MPKYVSPLDLNKNELRNARIQNLATAPSSPVLGQIYYDTDDDRAYVWTGTWEAFDNDSASEILTKLLTVDGAGSGIDADNLDGQSGAYHLSRANHTGTQLAATISDFNAAVQLNRLDQLAAPTADVSLNSQKITNLATPTAATDAASKGYVDGLLTGLDWKNSVRVATTTAGTLASDFENGDTVDGVTLATGNRILIKNQATASENGIYTVNASGAPTRATDADASAEVTAGMAVWVAEGTTNGDSAWALTTNDPITLGSTNLTFAQISGGAGVSGGDGLTLTGSVLSVNVDGSSIEINSDTLRVKAAGITNAMLAGSIDLTTKVTGILPVANGGTNANTAAGARTSLGAVGKYSALIGNGSATTITIEQATHGLASDTTNIATVQDATTGEQIYCDIVYEADGGVAFTFTVAPTSNQYRVVIIG